MDRQRADRISGIVIGILVFAAFALVARTVATIASGPVPPHSGTAAPVLVTTTPSGAAIGLADLKDRVVLVDFWATWCPPCVASMPALERLHNELGSRGFTVLGVNQEKGEERMVTSFLTDRKITFPIGMDDGKIAKSWGVYTYPTSFLLGRDGMVRKMYRGVANERQMRADIEEALAEGKEASAGLSK